MARVNGLSLKRILSYICMKYHYLFGIFAILAMAELPVYAQLPEPLFLDTLPPKPTLEDRLKAKSKDLETVRKYVDELLFRNAIHNTEDPRTYPVPAGAFNPSPSGAQALYGYDQQLLVSRNTGDRKKEAEALNGFGDYYALVGDLDKSVQYYKEALQIRESLRNRSDLARTSFRLAGILTFKQDLQEALAYYQYAGDLAGGGKQPALEALSYVEIGKIKLSQHRYEEAERFLMKKALPLYTRYGNKTGRIICFENLARLYEQQKRYSEAKWYYIQANLLGRKINNEGAVISSLISLGHVKNELGHLDLALQDLKEAEKLASGSHDVPRLIEIKSDLGDLYHRMGDLSSADQLIGEYHALRDTLMNTPR